MCTEFSRQRFLLPPAANCHCLESHPPCVLNSEMSQSSNAMYRYHVAAPRARISQRVVHGDACTHERSCFRRWQFVRNRCHCRRWRNHILGISAVKIDARNLAIDAHSEIAAPALFADEIMSAMPAYAHALAFFPFCNPVADCIDAPGDLMTGHTRILKSGPQTFFNENVAVTNAARFYFHADLSGVWLWNVAFDEFKVSTRFTDLRCLHFRAHKMLLSLNRAVSFSNFHSNRFSSPNT